MDLRVEWQGGGGARSKEEITHVEAPEAGADGVVSALWVYSFRSWMCKIGMVRSTRTQRLSQAPGQVTVYESEIRLTGWGSAGAPLAKIDGGMRAQAQALKARVEGG